MLLNIVPLVALASLALALPVLDKRQDPTAVADAGSSAPTSTPVTIDIQPTDSASASPDDASSNTSAPQDPSSDSGIDSNSSDATAQPVDSASDPNNSDSGWVDPATGQPLSGQGGEGGGDDGSTSQP
ncbi:uncharacterized protein JCM15063_004904, partial [Sporobolomyces koalae]|uniref:uncharacterized protein n=1 Tax=Sporobolomyces koalae TaxID=500713 RepID=UPI0031734B48